MSGAGGGGARFLVLGLCALAVSCTTLVGLDKDYVRDRGDGGGGAGGTAGGLACPNIQQLFVEKCATGQCHGAGIATASLDLESPGVAGRLVGTAAKFCQGPLASPLAPVDSVIYLKLTESPPCGSRMPSGQPALSEAELDCVLRWISELEPVEGGGGGGCPDADGDGHTADYCGGDDCADGDKRAFAGQEQYFVTPVNGLPDASTLKYDFNCDGGEEGRYTSSVCKVETGGCDTSSHFFVPTIVKCGETAEFGHCINQGFTCPKEVEFVSKAQECR